MEKNLVSQNGFIEFYKRELGFARPSISSRRISVSEALVKRIDLYGNLTGHGGCVNTISFNSTGDYLVSGSDDRRIMFWEWATKTLKFEYISGHVDNVFDAKIVPFTDDRKIVTCAADGKVRLGEVLENGVVETKRIGKHRDRVHKLALEPGSPYILYSCGEDGLVQRYDLRTDSSTKLFHCTAYSGNRSRSKQKVRLNTIVINPRNAYHFSTGGSDSYARVYDIRKYRVNSTNDQDSPIDRYCPHGLMDSEKDHITSLAYSNTNELLVSYSDEFIYLFQKNMGLGLLGTSPLYEEPLPQVYSGHRNSQTVKGVNFFGPHDEYVMSGSDCGNIFIWNKKEGKLIRMMSGDTHIVNQVEPNPHSPVIATSGIEKSIKIWGLTSDDNIIPLPPNVEEIMDANNQGRTQDSGLSVTPDVLMRIVRLHRRQAMAYNEGGEEMESEEEEEDAGMSVYPLSYADGESDDVGNAPYGS